MRSSYLFSDSEPRFQASRHADLPIPISIFASVHDKHTTEVNNDETWGDVVAFFKRAASTFVYDTKTDAYLYGPTTYRYNQRLAEFATNSALLVVDADAGMQYQWACDRLAEDGLEAIIHTWGSNIHSDKFRIIVPLLKPVPVEEQPSAAKAFCRYLDLDWKPDLGKLNAVSIFYVPGRYRRVKVADGEYQPADNRFCYLSGAVIGGENWIQAFPDPNPPPKPSFASRATSRPASREGSNGAQLSRSAKWDINQCHSVRKYENLGQHEHHRGLYGMLHGIAMSAYNSGYALTVEELADFAWDKQAEVLGEHPPRSYKRWQIEQKTAEAIADARNRIPDPWFIRRKKYWPPVIFPDAPSPEAGGSQP